VWSGPTNSFVSAVNGAPIQRGPTATTAAVDSGGGDPNPANLAEVAQAAIAKMAEIAPARVAAATGELTTFDEAVAAVHRLADGQWPVAYSLALSLDAAECIAVSLLDAWDDARDSIKEGADLWAATLDTYTEKCWTGQDATTALRALCRGKLPSPCRPPTRLEIKTDGFVTLTCQRINPRPAWQGDSGGVIRDCTEALAHLLTPGKPSFIER
jgi:hypothetical protein